MLTRKMAPLSPCESTDPAHPTHGKWVGSKEAQKFFSLISPTGGAAHRTRLDFIRRMEVGGGVTLRSFLHTYTDTQALVSETLFPMNFSRVGRYIHMWKNSAWENSSACRYVTGRWLHKSRRELSSGLIRVNKFPFIGSERLIGLLMMTGDFGDVWCGWSIS